MAKKLNIYFIRAEFKKENYELLTGDYINSAQKLDYICPKGHRHSISWNNWNHPKKYRCPYCYGNAKYTIGDVKNAFEKEKYILLSNIYNGINDKMFFVCPKGHIGSISFNSWIQKHRCFKCSYEHRFDSIRKNINDIEKKFYDEDYILLTKEYINSNGRLDYICKRGHKHHTTWSYWQQGIRCPYCHYEDTLGSGNPSWKGGASKEPYCQDWTKDLKEFVKARDGFKCLNPYCSGKDSTLAVHHIDYNKKSCGAENLITVCRACNGRANKNRRWHEAWYKAILNKRYHYIY